jgi:Uma2 family endonuclease
MNDDVLLETPTGAVESNGLEEDRRFERLEDEQVERMMGVKAGRIVVILTRLLDTHVTAQQLGLVFGADCGYQIFPHAPRLVRYPDASFVRHERLPADLPDGNWRVLPDLVVEVVSPNDLAENVETRVMDFVRAGVPLIWVLYPNTRCARVLRKGGTATQLAATDELQGEDVVPGFRCRVEDLFPSR